MPTPSAPRSPLAKRKLGLTGIEVTELALGTWGLSGEAYGPVSDADANAVIERAVSLGINLFDTSDSYNRGLMESRLGALLEKHKDTTYIVTRHGTDRDAEPPIKRFDAEYLDASLSRAQERLRRDRIDVFMLHNPSVSAVVCASTREFLAKAKEAGRIRAWGVSASSAEVARTAMSLGAQVISFPYNVLSSDELHSIVGEISRNNCGVLAHSVLSYGLLSGMWSPNKQFAEGDHRRDRWLPSELANRLKHLEAVRSLLGREVFTVRAAALRYVLANRVISSAVLGPRMVTQLEQLVREAGNGGSYLEDEKLARFPAKLAALAG